MESQFLGGFFPASARLGSVRIHVPPFLLVVEESFSFLFKLGPQDRHIIQEADFYSHVKFTFPHFFLFRGGARSTAEATWLGLIYRCLNLHSAIKSMKLLFPSSIMLDPQLSSSIFFLDLTFISFYLLHVCFVEIPLRLL